MTEQEQAKRVFEDLCDTMDQLQYIYLKAEDQYFLSYKSSGAVCAPYYAALASPDKAVLIFVAELDIPIPEHMLRSVALAVNLLNESIVFGSFDLDVIDRELYFRATHGFAGCQLGKGLLEQMIKGVERSVDAFREPLEKLIAEQMTMEQFIELLSL